MNPYSGRNAPTTNRIRLPGAPGMQGGFSAVGGGLGGLPRRRTLNPLAALIAALIAALFGDDEQGGLWLPGPDTCYTDNGFTFCTAPGDLVYRIDDLSGNGNHAIQATEAARPKLERTADGLWYLAFDGTDDFMDAGEINSGSDVYMCVATQILNYGGSARYIIGQNSGTLNSRYIISDTSNRIRGGHRANGTAQLPTITVTNPLDPKVITLEAYNTPPLTTLQINGETTVQMAISVGTGTYTANLRIGYFDANWLFSNLNFFGAVSREGITAAAQNTAARTLLAARSGVELP